MRASGVRYRCCGDGARHQPPSRLTVPTRQRRFEWNCGGAREATGNSVSFSRSRSVARSAHRCVTKSHKAIHVSKDTWPWATFLINLSGAFVLGAFLTVIAQRAPSNRYVRVFFATGFLGAYTTFSTMAVETVTLVRAGRAGVGFLYLFTSMTLGLVVAYAGVRVARATAC